MALHTRKAEHLCLGAALLLGLLTAASLAAGKYPLTLSGLLAREGIQWQVFLTLRLSRTAAGIAAGFVLGVAGFVYQLVFRNPLASPDILGVASGASAGAAAGILFLSGSFSVTLTAFAGGLLAVVCALALSSLDRFGRNGSMLLAGIAVQALSQTALMALKLTADPERELAAIEYWIMGSLNGISLPLLRWNLPVCLGCVAALFLLHRHLLLLSADDAEIRTLGADPGQLRLGVLLIATLAVAAVVSLTGLIGFVGLLAPHCAKGLTGSSGKSTLLLTGLLGSCLLLAADLLARQVGPGELPVSMFTSALGAPFLIFLVVKRRMGA